MSDSRLPGFYRLSIRERVNELERRGWLSADDANELRNGRHVLEPRLADRMIENVIASFGLPMAIASNFLVNGRDYVVPLVVEEPSIVAALCSAARIVRDSGGFISTCKESLSIGQVHLTGIKDIRSAIDAIRDNRQALLDAANDIQPRLVARGGGVRDIESRDIELEDGSRLLVVHLLVNTCDAMGANLVNTICEVLAPRLATLCKANVAMRILSNLADRSLVTARARISLAGLADDQQEAANVRDAIILANAIANADPYRAATHNKGIMNGIDALAIATGNDWRAIEAGVHAYAASTGRYKSLTEWTAGDDGDLLGEITLPLKAGTVGGTLDLNRAATIGLHIAGVASAIELAELMAAVGLAQNFAAIRALATAGIQKGHMRLHARSVAASAGVPNDLFDDVVDELVASGEVKAWKAREILAAKHPPAIAGETRHAAGKVILLGEHAVVYGRHALALPIEGAMRASAEESPDATLYIPDWGISETISADTRLGSTLLLIARQLGIGEARFRMQVQSSIPPGMGLGASATFAVCATRALASTFAVNIDDERVNAIAFECEKSAHGTPSGVDNTVATFARPILFRRGEAASSDAIELREVPPIVIAFGNTTGSTLEQVAAVRKRHDLEPRAYDSLFDEIDALTLAAAAALGSADYGQIGRLMNIGHGLLNAIGVSTPELEQMVSIARAAGAAGAKLTGGGGGGSIVAVCPGRANQVAAALQAAGFRTIALPHRDGSAN